MSAILTTKRPDMQQVWVTPSKEEGKWDVQITQSWHNGYDITDGSEWTESQMTIYFGVTYEEGHALRNHIEAGYNVRQLLHGEMDTSISCTSVASSNKIDP